MLFCPAAESWQNRKCVAILIVTQVTQFQLLTAISIAFAMPKLASEIVLSRSTRDRGAET